MVKGYIALHLHKLTFTLDRILAKELVPANLTNWGYQYMSGNPDQSNRILPTLLTQLFPNVKPESGGFTADELRTLFNVPSS